MTKAASRKLDDLRASAEFGVFQATGEDEEVIGRIVEEQQQELEKEIGVLKAEAERVAEEALELAGEVPLQ